MTVPNCAWPVAPSQPFLSGKEVHVWCVSLDWPEEDYLSLLSDEEQVRAGKFKFEQPRRRYVAGRGALRVILGRYLNLPPERLLFEYIANGKPVLYRQELKFNLSNSEDIALIAVTLNREVGIDIEHIRPMPDIHQLSRQVFSISENMELDTLPEHRQLDAFFRGWTCKEAYIKARGDGFSFPLDQFSVSLDTEQPARLLEVKGMPQELSRWSFYTFTPAPGYSGALVVAGEDLRISHWQFGG